MVPDHTQRPPQLIRPVTWVILLFYLFLGAFTIVIQLFWPYAQVLFLQTKLIVLINAIWFSVGIVGYGFYSLLKNRRRILLQKLNQKLDAQFLILTAFLMFALKQVIDLFVFLEIGTPAFRQALADGGKVFEFGGFMAGLASIYSSRKRIRYVNTSEFLRDDD